MPISLFRPKTRNLEPRELKAESERVIVALGGTVCDWLPWRERTKPRSSDEVADRALVLHACLQICFGAPTNAIASWIRANRLEHSLSQHDRSVLARRREELTDQEGVNLFWYAEALWAMMWAGQLIDELPIDRRVGDNLSSFLPDVQANEAACRFRRRFALRPYDVVYCMLDLYYRAHWYAREGQLSGQSTEPFNLDVIMERRRALEWISDQSIDDWDETPEDT